MNRRESAIGLCIMLLVVLVLAARPLGAQETAEQQRGVRLKFVGQTAGEKQAGRVPQLWAVIVGVSRFRFGEQSVEHTKIANLKYAADDAQAVYNFLRSDEGGGFRDVREGGHLMLLRDDQATRPTVEAALTALKAARSEDYFFVYIATHGVPVSSPDRAEESPYFLLYDSDPTSRESIARTSLRMEDFRRLIGDTPARKGLVVADTCHSAGVQMAGRRALEVAQSANRSLIERLRNLAPGVGFLSAAGQWESSIEADRLKHGVFTWCLLEGLRGHADADRDGVVLFEELRRYLLREVPRLTEQQQHPFITTTASAVNEFPLALVNYPPPRASESLVAVAEQVGTLVIRAPDLDGVEVAVDSQPVCTLSRTERTIALAAGTHHLTFVKGTARAEREVNIEAGRSKIYEANISFSSGEDEEWVGPSASPVAAVALQELREASPQAVRLWQDGVEHYNRQEFTAAAEDFNRAIAANGGAYYEALVYRGRTKQSLGHHAAAVQTLSRALQMRPSDYQTRTLLAEARLRAEDNVDEVEKELLAVVRDHPNDDYARLVLSDVYFLRRDFVRAERHARRAVLLRPHSPPAHLLLAAALTALAGQTAQANPDDEDAARAKLQEARDAARRALGLFEELARKRVSFRQGLKHLSLLHVVFAGARYASNAAMIEARQVLAEALNVSADYDTANATLHLAEARRRLDEALPQAKAMPDKSRYVMLLEMSARNRVARGETEAAIAEARQALQVSAGIPVLSDYPDAHYTLSIAYEKRLNPDYAEAAAHLEQYIAALRRRTPAVPAALEEDRVRLRRLAVAHRQAGRRR